MEEERKREEREKEGERNGGRDGVSPFFTADFAPLSHYLDILRFKFI
jgi:hypothetical protein